MASLAMDRFRGSGDYCAAVLNFDLLYPLLMLWTALTTGMAMCQIAVAVAARLEDR